MKRLHLIKFILVFLSIFVYEQQLFADAYAATDLRMSKSVNHSSREVNENFTYTLTVTNVHASVPARGVTITDNLPSGVTLVSSSAPAGWSCNGSTSITCSTTSNLNAGSHATITLTVKSSTTGNKVNQAEASSPSPEVTGHESDNVDSASINIYATQNADMQITKSADSTVYTDETVTYTLRVKNNGPDYAKNVSVTDALPSSLTNIHASGSGWSCSSGSNVTCNYNSTLFSPGSTKYITVTATAPHTPQSVSNTAYVTTSSTDSNSGNNHSTKNITVEQAPLNLYIGLYDSADPVNSGDSYDYIVNIENPTANVDADNVKVVVRLNSAVSGGYTGYTGSGWSCDPRSGNYVTCYYSPTLAAGTDLGNIGKMLYLHITAPMTQGTYQSKATVYDSGTEYDYSYQSTKIINTSLPADVRIIKSANKSTVSYGDNLYYYLKVKNLDHHNYAQNVTLTDNIPAHFTFKSFVYTNGFSCSHSGNSVSCSIASLKYNTQKTIKIKVKATGIPGGPYTNTAFIGSDNDNNNANNQSSVDVSIKKKNVNGKAYAQKWSNKNLVKTGELFYFKVQVKNRYSETLENILITDTLPNGVVLDHLVPRNSSLHCSDDGATPATITCTKPTLTHNEYTYVRIYVKVPTIAPDASKIFTNVARVQTHSATTQSNDTDDDQVEVYDPNMPGNVKITKSASSTTLYTGDTFDYTVTLRNMSASYIKNVTLTDNYPSEIEVLSVNKGDFNSCTTNTSTRTISCTESLLYPSRSQNIVIHAKAKDPGVSVRNVANLSAAQDNDSSDNEAEALIDIIDTSLETDLRVDFTDSSVTLDTDTDFYYTLRARNNGSVDANLVELNITMPNDFSQAWNNRASNGIAADLTYVSSTSPGWTCSLHGTKVISCTKAVLAASSSSTVKLKVHTPNQSGWIFTDATINSANLDLTPSNNTDTQNNLISEAQAGVPAMCYEEPPTYLGCTTNAGVGCKQTINVKNLDTNTLYDVKVFIDTTGYGTNYISDCGVNGASSGCHTGTNIYFLNGNFAQAIQFNSPYSYSSGATNSIYTVNNTNTPIYDGNNLFARYYRGGKNHYGALHPCPLPEPDPGDEPNYNSCGIFPDVLNEGLLTTFAFPTILETNSFNDIVTSDLGGSNLTDYLYRDIEVNTNATFAPVKTYNNSSRKLMLIDHLNVTASNVTLTFNAGNYYINEFSITGDNVTINVNGKVRFFIGGTAKNSFNVTSSGFSMNAGGTTSNLYLFSTGEVILNSNSSSTYNINGYLYSTKAMTISYNANANHFTGAFSTENSMNTVANSTVFTYVDTDLVTDGYGECPRSNYGDRNFVIVNPKITRNLLGDVRTVGNTVTCISDNNSINGSCRTDSNTVLNENSYVLYTNVEKDEGRNNITVDGASVAVFNSSGALVDINVSSSYTLKVEWAGLYWQGNIHNWNSSHASGNESWLDTTDLSGQTIDLSDASQFGQNSVALHTPSMNPGEYKEVTTSGNYFYDYYNIYETDYAGAPENGGVYSIYTDITDIIKAEPNPNGEYRIANLKTMKGKEKNLGNFGGWSLVIIYSVIDDPDQKFKNISVYSGYKIISSNHSTATSIAVSGFRTPSTLPIESTLSIFAGEGEADNDGDYGHLTTSLGTNNLDSAHSDNLFRGIISGDTSSLRTPAHPNTNGIDIQNFDVGSFMGTEESSASIELGTNLDTFFPSMVTFATELHKPNICYDYAIKQNGHFLPVDLPSNGVPDLNQTVLTGSSNPLQFNIYLKNREGDIQATKLSLHTNFYNTPNDYMHYYNQEHSGNNGSVWKSDVNTSYYLPYYDSSSMVSIINQPSVKGIRIGIGNNPTTALNGGSLGLQESQYIRFSTYSDNSKLQMKFKLYLDMILKFNDGIELNLNDYALGSQIKRCEPSTSYNPVWGQFTVIDSKLNQGVTDPANLYYNLRTQVSQRDYAVSIVSLKESQTNTDTTLRNHWEALEANTTVNVELADLTEFSDINASCGDSFNGIPNTSEFVTFGMGSGEWTKDLNITSTPYARPNLTYRIWFLEDENGTLVQHNCGNPFSSGNCYRTLYANVYAPTSSFCSAACSSNDANCYQCLKGKYGKSLCSRDNFSIRPEAFDIEGLKDVNNSLSPLLDTTHYTLVNESNDSLSGGTTHHIAARYNYRLDINATGYCYKKNTINTRGVPGYNNVFSGNQNFASFKWFENPPVTCADESDQNISLAFNNTPFSTSKTMQNVSNIGKYTISLKDTSWTDVDKDANAPHHNNAQTRNFFLGLTGNKSDDCKQNSTFVPKIGQPFDSVSPTRERYIVGCDFASQYNKLDDNSHTCNPVYPYSIDAHQFNDYNITSHPSHINMVYNDNSDIKEINNANSTYIYMNSVINNVDNKMNTYVDVSLSAVARDMSILSNYTKSCYAQGVDMNLNSTTWYYGGDYNLSYMVSAYDLSNNRFVDFNTSANDINYTISQNIHTAAMTSRVYVTEKAFRDDMNGSAKIKAHINFDKNITKARNPFRIHFNDANLTCTQNYNGTNDIAANIMLEDCNFTMDGYSGTQSKDYPLADKNITFVYGRVHAPRYRVVGDEANITLFYEAYCDIKSGSDIGCSTLLRDLVSPNAKRSVNSVNWYQNEKHTTMADGNVSSITPVHANRVSDNITAYNKATLKYDKSKGFPYRATMKINTSDWLIYNKFEDDNTTANRFEMEFRQKGTRPSRSQGISDDSAAVNSNRRIMW